MKNSEPNFQKNELIKMNWENILKEGSDGLNARLHRFYTEIIGHRQIAEQYLAYPLTGKRDEFKEILELSEKLQDKLEVFLESYFKKLD